MSQFLEISYFDFHFFRLLDLAFFHFRGVCYDGNLYNVLFNPEFWKIIDVMNKTHIGKSVRVNGSNFIQFMISRNPVECKLYLRLIQKTRILSDTVLHFISFDPWLRYFMLSSDIRKIGFDFYQFDPKE